MCSKPSRVVSTRRHEPLFHTRYTSLGHTLDTRGTERETGGEKETGGEEDSWRGTQVGRGGRKGGERRETERRQQDEVIRSHEEEGMD